MSEHEQLHLIARAVTDATGVTLAEMRSRCQRRTMCYARHLFAYGACVVCGLTQIVTGRLHRTIYPSLKSTPST